MGPRDKRRLTTAGFGRATSISLINHVLSAPLMLGEKTFLGVPVQGFEKGGRELLVYLLNAGLNPDSKVIDIGCGVLRGGYWLIHFLDTGCYCGIEPHKFDRDFATPSLA